ncbi:MAG: recombination protein NinB, partial [Cypionkella sp.]|nr:recombination protein NinB [Cypionkella sp.]
MSGQTIILRGASQRLFAKSLIDAAPPDAVVVIRSATRTTDQNAKLWAMLSDVSRAMPQGRRHTTEVWKCLFMQACGHDVQFEVGLNDKPFPVGFSSSRMTKTQMSDLIEFVYA